MNQAKYQRILEYKEKLEKERQRYANKMESILNAEEELEKLKQDPKVKAYFAKIEELKNLREEVDSSMNLSDEQIMKESIHANVDKEDKEIYIFYEKYTKEPPFDCDENTEDYDYIIYDNIPFRGYTEVNKENVKTFESSHVILHSPKDMEKSNFIDLVYQKYCEALINFGPEEAKRQIINEFHGPTIWASANQRILNRFMKKN